jgi:hypothetical protein
MSFGGKVMVIGVGKAEQIVPFMWLSAHEIDLMYLYRYSNQVRPGVILFSIAPTLAERISSPRSIPKRFALSRVA